MQATADATGGAVDELDVSSTDEWERLVQCYEAVRSRHLRDIFADDPDRGTRMTVTAGDLALDYSKHRIDEEALAALFAVARRAGVEERRDAMFAGRHINTTENRAVLHVALRMPRDAELVVDGQDVVADVHRVLDRMGEVAERIRSGEWTGQTGKRITTVVNIGIGGSDLGPAMAYEALRDAADPAIQCRFVSNIDPVDLYAKTGDLDPAETLFVVSSKTFTTLETLTNASAARHGCSPASAAARKPWPTTSWPCPPTRRASVSSASTPTTCSSSGTGWAAGTPSTPPSASR